MIVGSAPLAGNVLTFMRCALGCLIVEGYGQTECTAPVSLTIYGDSVPEHVGPPVACNCVKVFIVIFANETKLNILFYERRITCVPLYTFAYANF